MLSGMEACWLKLLPWPCVVARTNFNLSAGPPVSIISVEAMEAPWCSAFPQAFGKAKPIHASHIQQTGYDFTYINQQHDLHPKL